MWLNKSEFLFFFNNTTFALISFFFPGVVLPNISVNALPDTFRKEVAEAILIVSPSLTNDRGCCEWRFQTNYKSQARLSGRAVTGPPPVEPQMQRSESKHATEEQKTISSGACLPVVKTKLWPDFHSADLDFHISW